MSIPARIYRGGPIFDGRVLHQGAALRIEAGRITALGPEDGADGEVIDLGGDILAPAFVDLQVNGGGGVMFNDAPTAETLGTIAAAHRGLGVGALLPTLITDTPDHTRAAVTAARQAIAAGVAGIAGLHLEGPHLSLSRKGAHDPALIRPMSEADLIFLVEAARSLPALMITIAPESVTPEQAAALTAAGAVLSLGHTDADYETCLTYHRAGVRCVTHLFNAMSQLGNRTPGLVGAALDCGGLSAGMIADGLHVHPATMRAALAAKAGPGTIFLVSDAMAPAGSDLTSFTLNGRVITRAEGRLTLEDGTLAGADLDLTTAIGVLVREAGVEPALALRAATSAPAEVAGLSGTAGRLVPGQACDVIRIRRDFSGCAWMAEAGVPGQ